MKREGGFIVFTSLVITTAVLLLMGVFLGGVVNERRAVERSYRVAQALNAAEAGVEKAIWELNNNPTPPASGSLSSSDLEGAARTEYTIVVSGPAVTIRASGYSPSLVDVSASRIVNRVVQVDGGRGGGSSTVFDMALFALSGDGTALYIENLYKVHGDMGTNSTSEAPKAVVIKNKAEIDGTVWVGAGGDPTESVVVLNSATISDASVLPDVRLPSNVEVPPMPSPIDDQGALSVTGLPRVVVTGDTRYDSVSTSGQGEIEFASPTDYVYIAGDFTIGAQGPVIVNADMALHVAGDFTIAGQGELRIEGNHRLVMYVEGDITAGGQGITNTSNDPLNLFIYAIGTDQKITYSGQADYYGAIYGETASVNISGQADVHGAIVASQIEGGGQGEIWYDERLGDPNNLPPGSPTYGGSFEINSWQQD